MLELFQDHNAYRGNHNRTTFDDVLKLLSCSCIKPIVRNICIFALFISIAATIGILTVCFTAPKSSTTCQLSFKRLGKSSIIYSSQPQSIALGDFNHDRRMDIVVVNSGTNNIGIFLSADNGKFKNQQIYSTGYQSRPYSIVVNDFNNDNCLDIAVANYGVNNIGIFYGYCNGTFASQNVFSTESSRPFFITSCDINNDNQSDIIVVNHGTDNIGILLGYGNGSFQVPTTYFTGYDSIPYSLAVADFNKDNQLDIVIANAGTNNIAILLGFGNGSFARQTIYTTTLGSNPYSVAIGDFNNDNKSDITVANYATGTVGVFLGFDNGTFSTQILYSIGVYSRPQDIAVGDFDKDNQLDVVVVDAVNNEIYILLGSGDGSFAATTTYDAVSQSRPFFVVVADLYNNHQSDIIVVNYGTNNVNIFIGYNITPSARTTKYFVGTESRPTSVVINYFTIDKQLDIVVNNFGNDSILLLAGLGNGTFARVATYSTGYQSAPQYLCVGDLNNDTRMDIVTANLGSDSVGVLLGKNDGTFDTVTTYSTGINSAPWSVAIGDVNNDRWLDIVSANTGTDSIGVLLGYGNGTFSRMRTSLTGNGSAPRSVAVGDFNADNQLDIVAAITGSSAVGVLLGYGNGSFASCMTYSSGNQSTPLSVAVADFNNDSQLDIVVANGDGNSMGIFLGYGNGTFNNVTIYPTGTGSSPYSVTVADFTNDNCYDIFVTYLGSEEVVIFFGYCNGSFELARTYSTGIGSSPYGIAVADLNNNNKLEIIVTLWGTARVCILTEYYATVFNSQTTYITGSAPQPYSIAVGDFNKDNRPDIVVANSGTDNLSIRLGLGNGTFETPIIYSIGFDSHPQYVMTNDIDKNNQLDLISVNSNNDSISIIYGYGNGTFAAQIKYSTGDLSNSSQVAVGILNDDNRLDLVIANQGTDNIGILFGYDYRTFQSQKTYARMNSLGPNAIVTSNLNNDNYLDIAVAFSKSNHIAVLLGCDNGSFTTMITYSTGIASQPIALVVADFNNDNQSDFAVANYYTNNIGILFGYGNGSFASIVPYSTGDGSHPNSVAVSDFNNDDRLDIVAANYGTNNIVIFLGSGNGSFTILMTYFTGVNSNPISVIVADFNNDNQSDIAVANSGTNNIYIFLGLGNGTFTLPVTYSTSYQSQPTWLAIGDFNKDNQFDIVTANNNNNNVGILLGHRNGTFSAVKTYSTGPGSIPECVMIGDFNNDNTSDIAVANNGNNNVVVLFGLGDGSFLLGTAYSTGIGSGPVSLSIGDFNNDTKLDIAVANQLSNNIGVFFGYGIQPFAGVTTYTTGLGSQPHSIAIGDFNNDDRSDIVVANYGTNNVGVLFGYGHGIFSTMIAYPTGVGSTPNSVVIGDFNSDNQTDIVVTNSGTDNVGILLSYGNGTFANVALYSTGISSNPYKSVIADFNNDNISDIAVANYGTNDVFLLYGYGNGTFGNNESYPLGYDYDPSSLVVTDLNQDAWMDIVVACYGTDNVEILMKMC